jgi:hypothetical protein
MIPGAFLGLTIGSVVRYVSRFPTTRNKVDLLKAAHYLLMLYQETPDPEPEPEVEPMEDRPETVVIQPDDGVD